MQIVEMKVEELIPYEKNPRKNDGAVDKVAASIREFGFKVPIVITSENVIVAGHTRLKAAKKLGIETVPCVIADDLSEEQIKAFRLADNRVSEIALWDYEMLDEELEDITDIDMSDFGFATEEAFDWEDVEEISGDNYAEPVHRMLECPACHHIDRDIHFKQA